MTGGHSEEEAAWLDLVAQFAEPAPDGGAAPWPDREELPPPATGAGHAGDAGGAGHAGGATVAGPADQRPPGPVGDGVPVPPRVRIIRPAGVPGPHQPRDVGGEDDEHYVPPPPPPLPHLDPVAKGAWLALFGGPGYLLIAVVVGWQVSGWAAFCAMAAFVGGFTTLVVRMGDRPPNDSGPDDGAVV